MMTRKQVRQDFYAIGIGMVLVAGMLGLAGCMTSKVTSVTANGSGGFSTNVVTVVNTNNLILDSAAFQGATAIAASIAIEKDPGVVPALKQAQIALDGVLNGASTNTVQDVLTSLKIQNNPVLNQQVSSLLAAASSLEQQLLAKYGVSVAGQITLSLAKAADAGLMLALQGH
ncbi:MAG: hypothetical protein KGL39_27980 [Patescibacteria group bacterium]|nr:hypothetical protein [Patescibacteria group bacterium]